MNEDKSSIARPLNPIEKSSFLWRNSFLWLVPLFRDGLQRPLTEADIYATLGDQQSGPLTNALGSAWQKAAMPASPNYAGTILFRTIASLYGWKLIFCGIFFNVISTAVCVWQPICLGGLISYFAPGQSGITKRDAVTYGVGIIVWSAVGVLNYHPLALYLFTTGMKIRVACCGLIYRKALQLSKSTTPAGVAGHVINLVSNDVARFDASIGVLHDTWNGPLQLLSLTYCIYREIGHAGLLGIAFLLAFIPLQVWCGKRTGHYRQRTAKWTDARVHFMSEFIQGLQLIKMCCWETIMEARIAQKRRKELNGIRGTAFIRAGTQSFTLISRLSLLLSFSAYVFTGNAFTARTVFVVTSYFNYLYGSMLLFWPQSLAACAETFVSIRRIEEFLSLPEQSRCSDDRTKENGAVPLTEETATLLKPKKGLRIIETDTKSPSEVVFANVSAVWNCEARKGITAVTFSARAGQLCAIVGPVGSGKSTILNVILGELEPSDGAVTVRGARLSYAAQEPWLFDGTLRQNIVFAEPWDPQRYADVVAVCALTRDFHLLPCGDQTDVGECGANLSGGQRARVNLARAIYRHADIYLLDDPLAAIDVNVGEHIFDKCVRSFLGDKCCVLVTHQTQYLRDVETVVLLNSDGAVIETGSFAELHLNFPQLLNAHDSGKSKLKHEQRNHRGPSHEDTLSDNNIIKPDNATTIESAESCASGSVKLAVYKSYFDSVGSRFTVAVVGVLFICAQLTTSGVDYLLFRWVNWEDEVRQINQTNSTVRTLASMDHHTAHRQHFVFAYAAGVIVFLSYFTLHRSFAFYNMCIRASLNLHGQLIRGLSYAPMYFINRNPTGRILNRFTKDLGCIDSQLPTTLSDCVSFVLETLAIVTLVAIANPWFLLPTMVMSIIFLGMRHVFIRTSRNIKRIEATTRSPVLSHANACIQGAVTIRACQAQERLIAEFDSHQNLNSSTFFLYLATTRAFAFWLDFGCVLFTTIVTLSFLLMDNGDGVDGIRFSGGNVGLAISQTFNLIFLCQWGMRQTAELENQMVSLERVLDYTKIEPESELKLNDETSKRATGGWPSDGSIEFRKLNLRYSPDASSTPALRDITVHIHGREKVGIIGRTGAGKSSIMHALFRIGFNEGTILMDGIDIRSVRLHDVRNRISIIPQEPILFSGRLRANLDPFGECSDADIWRALDQVNLATVIRQYDAGLQTRLVDGAKNFSHGQRQLLCLARAILRNNRILIMDEATANVDSKTDMLIQKTIREQFSECTILKIAHRLHTVMDCDRILVMEAGRLIEIGHPHELLQNGASPFRAMIDRLDPNVAVRLIAEAEKSYLNKSKAS